MKNYKKGDTPKSIKNNADYSIEKRINPEDNILFVKNMVTEKFSHLEEKYVTEQDEDFNLYFLINGYLSGKRSKRYLRKIFALGFDVDNLKEGMSDEELFKRLDEVEEYYGLRAHIINKTLGGYHIYFLLESTPYLPFKKEFNEIYEKLQKDLNADESFKWKVGILKVVGSYDFRKKGYIKNIRNEFHDKYKITDFNKIVGEKIFKKYEKIDIQEEFKKIEIEEIELKNKIDSYIFKVNDIPFSNLVQELKKENYEIEIKESKIYIKGNEGHGKALHHYLTDDRVVDFDRFGREKRGEKSRGSNYGFLNYLFSTIEKIKLEKENKGKGEITIDNEKIKEQVRTFIGKHFNIYYRNPANYINTNKLIYNEFLNGKISFDEEDKDFLIENGIINEKSELTNISKFLLLNLLKISEIDMTGFITNKTIYDLLKYSSLLRGNIEKQNKKYKTILFGLTKIYKDIKKKSKDSEKIRVYLVSDLNEINNRFSFTLLKNYFKLDRYEKNVYRGIFIGFINNEKLNIDKLDLYFYLYNSIINNVKELTYDKILSLFGGKTYLENKSLAKKNILKDLELFKSFITTTSIKMDIGNNIITLDRTKKAKKETRK